jgi:hypothetical protein
MTGRKKLKGKITFFSRSRFVLYTIAVQRGIGCMIVVGNFGTFVQGVTQQNFL